MATPTTPLPTPQLLEDQRQRLEQSLTKLRKALDNWRIYSFEYEAFREELLALPAGASRESMLAVGLELEGELVDPREITSLLGDKVNVRRSKEQVIAAVSHRIDYVDGNVKKVLKEVELGEAKLEELMAVIEPDVKTEEGLAVMDIQEELDEEGNVMNAWVNGKDPEAASRALDPQELLRFETMVKAAEKAAKAAETPKMTTESSPKAQETKTPPTATAKKSESAPRIEEVNEEDKEQEGGGYVRVIDDPEEPKEEDWIQSVAGETEEETRIRREMLSYNMQDIGAVVAELNLEEDGDYYGYEDYSDDEDFDEEEDGEEEEDEDKYGRATRRVVSESYRRQMEELEQRLTGKIPASVKTPAPTAPPTEPAKPPGKKGVRFASSLDIAPATTLAAPPLQPTTLAAPTEINFAPDENDAIPFLEKLLERQEIANAGPVPQVVPYPVAMVEKPKSKASLFKKEKMTPSPLRQVETPKDLVPPPPAAPIPQTPVTAIKDSIIERTPGGASAPVPPTLPKKMSRFMAAKMAAAAAAAAAEEEEYIEPEEPKGIMANTIVERAPTHRTSGREAPDELDPILHRQEVAVQFHKLRNKMIQQQGGFVETDEDRKVVLVDEEEGPKVSRFMAARLKGLGPM